uniref:GAG-pre-integrase domain-containing protein n=1 Tax=Fagus sylvatica TaxID=28930 RepID=A0A2N9FCJ3_FAGSY
MASSSTSSSSMVTSAPISTSLSNIINYVSIKLDETNYLLWRSQFVPILVANDLYGYVDGSITPPPTIINSTEGKESPNPDFLSWRKTDQFVLSCINATLTQSILAQVLGHSTAHQVWASLHLMFLEQSQARFDLLKGDIQSIQKGTSSISEYLNRLKHIADSLAALQHPVPDKELVGHALNGLGPEYTNFVVMMENREHPPTFSELRSRLFSHEQRLKRTSHHAPPMGDTALLSTYGSKTQHYPPYVQPTGHTNGSHNHGFPSQHNRLNQARQQQGNNRFPQSQFQSQSRETPPIIQSQNSDPCWYPDTGATSHMTADMPLLQQPQEYSGSDSVMVGNGAGLPISHTGNIYFHSFGSQFKLSDVLCVPAIKKNLLSVARFTTDNNCSFHFFPWGYRVQDLATGKVLLMGPIKDNLYPLPPFSATLRDQVGTFSKETAFLSSKTTPEIWHNRLGHPNFQVVSSLSSNKCLEMSSPLNKNFVCASCQLGKTPTPSISGYHYYIIFIDDFSRFVWLYPMKVKSDSVACFIHFKRMMENLLSTKIKYFQSDGALELTKGLLALLPISLIGFTTLVLSSKSPYELLFKSRPDYNILRTFGCTCYPYLGPYKQDKLSPKSVQCVFLGYSNHYKGYRCLDPKTGRVYTSRHVVFDESTFPFATMASDSPTLATHQSWINLPIPFTLPLPGLNSSTSTSPSSSPPSSSLQPSQSMTHPDHSSITNEFGPIRSTSSPNSSNGTPIPDPPITSPPSSPTPSPPPTTAVISEPPPPPLVPVHPMVTRLKDGIVKPKPRSYKQIVGALQYLTMTQPDLTYAVNQACQFMHSPTTTHLQAVKRILRYIKGTIDLGDLRLVIASSLVLIIVSWSCKKQPTVARSSAEAEYRALACAGAELTWLRSLLRELHILLHTPCHLYCDNVSATYIAANPVFHARTKHIEIDYHFIRDLITRGALRIQFVRTENQTVDIFTKGLASSRFCFLCDKLMMQSLLISLRGAVK